LNFKKKDVKKLLGISVLILLCSFVFGQNKFRASVVKIDITPNDSQNLAGYPERRSNGVHDHIFHRIVALDDG
jgi:hypothetical protein